MRRRVISGLLAAVFILGLVPQISLPARAATSLSLTSQTLTSGEYDLAAGSASGISIVINGNVTINVTGTTSINNSAGGGSPIDVQGGTLTLNVSGALTVTGQNATSGGIQAAGQKGYAGIRVASSATLVLKGNGSVTAQGGNAGDGHAGTVNTSSSTTNYPWGGGGGGGGAGIGGNGGTSVQYSSRHGESSGTVKIYEGISVVAKGGNGGDGGAGGNTGNTVRVAGGGGAGGYPGVGIGGGGGAGGNGGGELAGGGFSGGGGASFQFGGTAGYAGTEGSNGGAGAGLWGGGGGGGYKSAGPNAQNYLGGARYGGGAQGTTFTAQTDGGGGGSGIVYYRPSVSLSSITNGGTKRGVRLDTRFQSIQGLGGGYGYSEGSSDIAIICYIDFEPNGGSPTTISRQEVLSKNYISQPSVSRDNYALDGWYTSSGTKWNFATMHPSDDMTLTAKWKPKVKFEPNGGSAVSEQVVPVGAKLTQSACTKTGYTLEGWYTDEHFTPGTAWNFSTDTVTAPMTLYAKWKENLKVTYNGNGSDSGSVPVDNGVYFQGDSVVVNQGGSTIARTGYTFAGWNTKSDGSGTTYQNGDTFNISGQTTLYAKWTPNGLAVTFHLQGVPCSNYASDTWTVNANYNSHVAEPTPPTATGTGYTFQGWYADQACTNSNKWDFNNHVIRKAMDLYAKWDVTVNYDPILSSVMAPPAVTATVGGTLNTPTVTVPSGHRFVGWYTDNTFATQWAFGATGSQVKGPMTLYAKWEVTVTFNLQGHGGTISPISNATVGLPLGSKAPADPTETGWTFGGWFTDAACTPANKWDMGTSTVQRPTTLYAKWTEKQHTVTYLSGGATVGSAPTDSSSPYKFGSSVTVMGEGSLSWPGKIFNGWKDQNGVSHAAGSTFTMPDNDMTLTAQWSNGTYSVEYNANTTDPKLEGSVPTDGNTYGYGDPVIIQGNTGSLRWPGHTFLGWNTSSTATSALSGSYTIQDNTTFFAIWEEDEYSVTYNGNGASGTAPSDNTAYLYDATVTVKGNTGDDPLVKTGATFKGWNTQPDGSGKAYAPDDTFKIESDVTLYAVWESEHYHITYNGNHHTSGEPPLDEGSYVLDAAATILGNSGNLERAGYTFEGWNTSSEGTGTDYTAGQTISMTGNLLLYAKWKAIEYSVSYDANGADSGDVPTDGNAYHYNQSVTVLGNVGTPSPLTLVGKSFAGWAMVQTPTASDPIYSAGSSFQITHDTTLYAQWKDAEYHVTYVGNGADGGTLPVDPKGYGHGTQALVMANTLTRTNHVFKEWNTQADGLGTSYVGTGVGSIPSMTADVTLYAIWEEQAFTVTYSAPGATGTVPTDTNTYASMDTVTVLGRNDLERTGYSFAGWNTKADGSGTTYKPGATFFITESTDLYAVWSNLYYIYISANTNPVIFDAAHRDYTATVPYEIDFVDLAVAYSEGTVTYSIGMDNPATATPLAPLEYVKVPLNVGVNKIYVHGTDALGRTLNYVYTVTRQQKSSGGGGGGGGGGGTTYYYPVVYLPGEGGTLPGDVATEQVSSGGKPKKVPTVTEKGGYVFKGWSLDGKRIVDPTTVKVKELTTFIALYEFDESSVPEHVWYMQGYGNGLFRPDDPLSRSEITAMLSRLDPSYRQGAKLPSFPDVGASAWYYSYVGHAQGVGLIHGYPDGTFRPDNKISRAEFVTIMCNHLGLKNTGSATFTDTSGHWAEGYIAQLTALGVLNGYPDGTFRPDGEISRSEAAKIVNRVYQRQPDPELVKGHALHYDDVPSHHWAWSDIVEASYTHKTTEFH